MSDEIADTLNLFVKLPDPGFERERIIFELMEMGQKLSVKDTSWGLAITPGIDGQEYSLIAGSLDWLS